MSAVQDESITEDIICFFDALDECPKPHRNKLIEKVSQFYDTKPNSKSAHRIKFFVTSQPHPEIEQQFRRYLINTSAIRLAGENESELEEISKEITNNVKTQVSAIAHELELSAEIESSICRRLVETTNRTYLWLHLTLDEIRGTLGHTEKKLLKVIDELPETAEQAYEKILAKCHSVHDASALLRLIIAANRPLTLDEIDVALEIQENSTSCEDLDLQGSERREKWNRKCCGLFVSIVGKRVMLIHETAREFLIKRHETNRPGTVNGTWRHSIDEANANLELAQKCVAFLSFTGHLDASNRHHWTEFYHERRFLEYAARYWSYHIRCASLDSSYLEQIAKICDLEKLLYSVAIEEMEEVIQENAMHLRSDASRLRSSTKDREWRWSSLFWAVILGLSGVATFLTARINVKGKIPEYVMIAAVTNRYEEGIMPDKLPKSAVDRKALTGAAATNTSAGGNLVALLLRGRFYQVYITQKVLQAAAANRIRGEEIVKLLLRERGYQVEITERVLIAAASNRDQGEEIMTLLLRKQAHQVEITERVLNAVLLHNVQGHKIIGLLLRNHLLVMTDGILIDAATKPHHIEKMLEVVFQNIDSVIAVTECVLKSLAEKAHDGRRGLQFLIVSQIDIANITESVIESIIRHQNAETVKVLLEKPNVKVKITEELIFAAERNFEHGNDNMKAVLEVIDYALSEHICWLLLARFNDDVLRLIPQKLDRETQNENVLGANSPPFEHILSLLLATQDRDFWLADVQLMLQTVHNNGLSDRYLRCVIKYLQFWFSSEVSFSYEQNRITWDAGTDRIQAMKEIVDSLELHRLEWITVKLARFWTNKWIYISLKHVEPTLEMRYEEGLRQLNLPHLDAATQPSIFDL